MSHEFHDLSYRAVMIASILILFNGAISVALRLQLERRLLLAAVRTIVQLLVIGFLLQWVFQQQHWFAVLLWMGTISVIAGLSAVGRVDRKYRGMRIDSLTAVICSSWLMTGIALTAIIKPSVWENHPAQYAIPLLGMILGNTLNGISLGLNRLTELIVHERNLIEMRLSLGATRWEAARDVLRQAVRTGMIPIINSMMVVGLVCLPGLMTGQLLAGASPVAAVKYQIVIMFLIAAGTGTGTILVVLLGYRRLFNPRHQFRQGPGFGTQRPAATETQTDQLPRCNRL